MYLSRHNHQAPLHVVDGIRIAPTKSQQPPKAFIEPSHHPNNNNSSMAILPIKHDIHLLPLPSIVIPIRILFHKIFSEITLRYNEASTYQSI